MTEPKIFVLVDRDHSVPHFAQARIRDRIKGPSRYRYLVWRNGKVQEFYLGKVTLQKEEYMHEKVFTRQMHVDGNDSAWPAGAGRSSGAGCRVKQGGTRARPAAFTRLKSKIRASISRRKGV